MTRADVCLLAALGTGLLACNVLDPSFAAPARIVYSGDTAQINIPATVVRGTAFDISIRTFAGGCTRSIARTWRQVEGLSVEIHPYNETMRSDVCTADLRYLIHRVTVRLDQPGTATIRIVGVQRPPQRGSGTSPAELTRTVVVQ